MNKFVKFALVAIGLMFAAHSFSAGVDPQIGMTLAMAGAIPVDIASQFNRIFEMKEQFPRWFQPHPNIGSVLVHSQEEEDELAKREWAPKPLPGSEVITPKTTTIEDLNKMMQAMQAEREKFAAEQAAWFAKMSRVADAAEQAAAPASTPSAAPGLGLSDAPATSTPASAPAASPKTATK